MNTTRDQIPASAPAKADDSQHGLVLCVTGIPACSELTFPKHNRIGLRLLEMLFHEAALLDGHHPIGSSAHCGELNKGRVIATYERPALAAATWLTVLQRAGIQSVAHLAWRDRDGQWHPVHPQELSCDFSLFLSPAALDEAAREQDSVIDHLKEAIRAARLAAALKGQS